MDGNLKLLLTHAFFNDKICVENLLLIMLPDG